MLLPEPVATWNGFVVGMMETCSPTTLKLFWWSDPDKNLENSVYKLEKKPKFLFIYWNLDSVSQVFNLWEDWDVW